MKTKPLSRGVYIRMPMETYERYMALAKSAKLSLSAIIVRKLGGEPHSIGRPKKEKNK